MLGVVARELKGLLAELVLSYPATSLGFRLRRWWYRFELRSIGRDAAIGKGAYIGKKGLVEIGTCFQLGDYASIDAGDSLPVFIGNHVAIARHSYIRSANHRCDDLSKPIMFQGHESKSLEHNGKRYSVVIEDDVWIGANCVILTGTHVGVGSVIGANSVVSGPIPPYSVVMGNPARVLRSRRS